MFRDTTSLYLSIYYSIIVNAIFIYPQLFIFILCKNESTMSQFKESVSKMREVVLNIKKKKLLHIAERPYR